MADFSKIKFNSLGFWIHQAFIEVLSEYICETFESIGVNTFSAGLQKIYGYCDFNRQGANVGMSNILFDNGITSVEDKTAMIDVLNQTKTLIASKGPELSIATLEAFESRKTDDYFKIPWSFPIKTQSLIATIDIIIQVLNGTWAYDDYSVRYTGFPNPTKMPEI
ncbi:hypothetical protein BEL04_08315 [Mucilaginibacter sp. PPCGB 2223]|uniref:hypothetical protein n=1 Tax=Mucilaginibacter sp. PPCGB 2223 TaxID=1886027 RepID=UPI0008251AEF|nr:hypothetical protein [Mucilaginibacter sp. PPCGB 2223]OCX54251.1 hypothetical protein BEL04_08315 [Mucilaginibacter sp. PPCGB 2223]